MLSLFEPLQARHANAVPLVVPPRPSTYSADGHPGGVHLHLVEAELLGPVHNLGVLMFINRLCIVKLNLL